MLFAATVATKPEESDSKGVTSKSGSLFNASASRRVWIREFSATRTLIMVLLGPESPFPALTEGIETCFEPQSRSGRKYRRAVAEK